MQQARKCQNPILHELQVQAGHRIQCSNSTLMILPVSECESKHFFISAKNLRKSSVTPSLSLSSHFRSLAPFSSYTSPRKSSVHSPNNQHRAPPIIYCYVWGLNHATSHFLSFRRRECLWGNCGIWIFSCLYQKSGPFRRRPMIIYTHFPCNLRKSNLEASHGRRGCIVCLECVHSTLIRNS